ncbi:transcriptional regulator [Streptococcus pneumoniae]|nr:transcriptional regulator [Streptococcus pneumoniae]VTI12991.1 transcriptional regulator [Streptococcus pneumoniae]
MLNKYIEKRITDKITILNILLDIRSIELDELSTLTSLQSKSLLSIPKFQVEVSHPKEIHLATCSPSIF